MLAVVSMALVSCGNDPTIEIADPAITYHQFREQDYGRWCVDIRDCFQVDDASIRTNEVAISVTVRIKLVKELPSVPEFIKSKVELLDKNGTSICVSEDFSYFNGIAKIGDVAVGSWKMPLLTPTDMKEIKYVRVYDLRAE